MRSLHRVSFALLALVAIPIAALAQTGVVVGGRVFEEGGTTGIPTARVELVGHGSTLTSADGSFRFDGVMPGRYTFRVVAFGYASESRFLPVESDTTVSVPLEVAPVLLDSLLIGARAIDIEGGVRDPEMDIRLVDAEVLTNQGVAASTDRRGRFRLERVLEGVRLQVSVRAFGYLPLDSIIVPTENESYAFELEADPVVEAMIDEQVERIEERAAARRSVVMRPMNRQRLLRFAGTHTLRAVLEGEYRFYLERVRCVIIDEQQQIGVWEPSTLFYLLPEEIERIEFLFRGAMLRIYTREFMQEMIARNTELREPIFFAPPRSVVIPLCR